MSKIEKGYVYTVTNPSFHDGWVKIGRTSQKVEMRLTELYNTSVPLPFQIYATVRTTKFVELERQFHKILTELADARIDPKREFFNIAPQKALEHLAGIAKFIPDAKIMAPDEVGEKINIGTKKTRQSKGKYTVNTDKIFYLKRLLADGRMKIKNGNEYVVLEGSVIDPNTYPGMGNGEKLRKKHSSSIKENIVISDVSFTSPSSAGEFVAGGSINGKYYWRTEDDRALEEFIEYL